MTSAAMDRPTFDGRRREASQLAASGKLAEAQASYHRLHLDLSNPWMIAQVMSDLSALYLLMGDIPSARATCEGALSIDRASAHAWANLNVINREFAIASETVK